MTNVGVNERWATASPGAEYFGPGRAPRLCTFLADLLTVGQEMGITTLLCIRLTSAWETTIHGNIECPRRGVYARWPGPKTGG